MANLLEGIPVPTVLILKEENDGEPFCLHHKQKLRISWLHLVRSETVQPPAKTVGHNASIRLHCNGAVGKPFSENLVKTGSYQIQ